MQALLKFAFEVENQLFVNVIAINEDIVVDVSLRYQYDDPIFQSHREFDFILLFAHNVRISFDHDIMRGLEI